MVQGGGHCSALSPTPRSRSPWDQQGLGEAGEEWFSWLYQGGPQHFQGSSPTLFLGCEVLGCEVVSFSLAAEAKGCHHRVWCARAAGQPGCRDVPRPHCFRARQREDGGRVSCDPSPGSSPCGAAGNTPPAHGEAEGAASGLRQWVLPCWKLCGLQWVRVIIMRGAIAAQIITKTMQ